ncbi:hypothetical protein [Neisseria chenwenguii]|uniref:Uncharacterized protein n=1 Tax=Neisseria chenwenguii TaxID=1853278 RepID=A0A220S1K1_9NEIS|nr:hypothetical protein [Neisseria chenwenguii]ASK27283.1 hypothetical protein BG910_05600 [Neisseria chenwenguii]ROV57042.1 hypothetical protein EGS38_02560 [Neisseria chenwenguii]
MKKLWEMYKKNLIVLGNFPKNHFKAFAAICFGATFVIYAVNFILSVFIINPKYFLGNNHFLPSGVVAILSAVLVEIMM